MHFPVRRHLLVVGLGLGTVGALWVAGLGFRDLGLDFYSVPELRREREAADRRGDVLEARRLLLSESIRHKEVIIQDLRAGRISLREAAARFEATSATPLDAYLPEGQTHEERLCRLVIQWVKRDLAPGSDMADEVLARLEDELTQLTPLGTVPTEDVAARTETTPDGVETQERTSPH